MHKLLSISNRIGMKHSETFLIFLEKYLFRQSGPTLFLNYYIFLQEIGTLNWNKYMMNEFKKHAVLNKPIYDVKKM